MKIAIAQINTTVGDFEGNSKKIISHIKDAEKKGADLVIFPEMSIASYPPNDLLENPDFISKSLRAAEAIAKKCTKIAAVVGLPMLNKSSTGNGLFNSAAVLAEGRVDFIQNKALLPTYDVFYEGRYFEPGTAHIAYTLNGVKIGITICEDIWSAVPFNSRKLYRYDPVEALATNGAQIIVNCSASPFYVGKDHVREKLISQAAIRNNLPIIYVNSVGANDDLVFDGHSLVVNAEGEIVREGTAFEEELFLVEYNENTKAIKSIGQNNYKAQKDIEQLHQSLLLGLSDYMNKSGFKKAVIGLSGGIDSAVVAALAVEALGSKNVLGVAMPSPYSSKSSVTDAQKLAKNLGIEFKIIPISEIYNSYLQIFKPQRISLVEENIQARIRGNILMGISNKTNAIVLSTGNKSELAVGYCTLYGDMAGGLALISDVPKTAVYRLAKEINRKKEIIPRSTMTKPPSAELRPNQKDTDSLPPYEVLDEILRLYIEEHESPEQIIAAGFAKKVVEDIVHRVDRNEYKRRQAAPGIKVTSKAFGAGRRYPIVWKR